MKNYLIIIIVILGASNVFAQKKGIIVLKDSTKFDCKVLWHDDDEVKLITNGKMYDVKKENILHPDKIKIHSPIIYTVIETENKLLYGKVFKQTDSTFLIKTSFNREMIHKDSIKYQAFYASRYYETTESYIKTKDGNLFVGDVLKSNQTVTLIDVGNGMQQEINNELITERKDKRLSKGNAIKSFTYGGLALLGVILLFN